MNEAVRKLEAVQAPQTETGKLWARLADHYSKMSASMLDLQRMASAPLKDGSVPGPDHEVAAVLLGMLILSADKAQERELAMKLADTAKLEAERLKGKAH